MSKPIVLRDPTKTKSLYSIIECPDCGRKAWIDDEQYRGEVSMVCECGWHETHDMRGEGEE